MFVCVCVQTNRLKGAVEMGVAYCQKMHNFQMDLLSCTTFNGEAGHESKDSRLTVGPDGQKGAWQWE